MLTIDKDVAIPVPARAKYPFKNMMPGDSVFISGGKIRCKEHRALDVMACRKGWKIRCRSVEGGMRMWRVS